MKPITKIARTVAAFTVFFLVFPPMNLVYFLFLVLFDMVAAFGNAVSELIDEILTDVSGFRGAMRETWKD